MQRQLSGLIVPSKRQKELFMKFCCPHCHQKYEISEEDPKGEVECGVCGNRFLLPSGPGEKSNGASGSSVHSRRMERVLFLWRCFCDLFRVGKLRAELESRSQIIHELGLADVFEKKQAEQRLDSELTRKRSDLRSVESKIEDGKSRIKALEQKIRDFQPLLSVDEQITQKEKQLEELKKHLVETDDEVLMQSFGLYQPSYDFASSDQYKERLLRIRERQKEMIRSGLAVTGNLNWTVNGNASQGRKMVADMQKLLLRAFNGECEEITDRVTYANFDASLKRIMNSFEAISKLGRIMNVAISDPYCSLKKEELRLAFEYRQKKQEEKERQKELRAQMREEARLQRELEEARKKIEKEQAHYCNALQRLEEQKKQASPEDLEKLNEKENRLNARLADIDQALKEIDYREANQKAGYVYVISNIGAFGENVYKIGMTRRLDPSERIDELGDASVPFNFDIHAMIFSENAPALENALHHAFEKQKLNWVNQRREFFHVTLDEIKAVVKANHDKTAEFMDVAPAEQYRISLKMKEELSDPASD